jgi:hypothetical protein
VESLRSFFLSWKAINPETLAMMADRFLRCATEEAAGAGASVDILSELIDIFPERGGAGRPLKETGMSFLEEVSSRLRGFVRTGGAVEVLEEWREALREAQSRIEILNISPQAVVESLFYRMRDALRGGALGGAR